MIDRFRLFSYLFSLCAQIRHCSLPGNVGFELRVDLGFAFVPVSDQQPLPQMLCSSEFCSQHSPNVNALKALPLSVICAFCFSTIYV